MAKIGISITGSVTPTALLDVLERAERLGFDEIWVSETFFGGGPISTASIALARTKLTVGFGVLSTAVRHAAALAMEISTLASLYPGRVRLGLGLGVASYLESMSLSEKVEKERLPAFVENTRRLLAGGAVRFAPSENRNTGDVRLTHAPSQLPPIILAGMGKRGLSDAARLGDGVLLSWVSSPAYILWAREIIAKSACGKALPWVGTNAMFTLCSDRAKARSMARATLARSLAHIPAAMVEPLGLMKHIAAYRGRPSGIPIEEVREAWIDELAVAGDERDCRAAMQRLVASGLDALILCPLPGEQLLSMLDGLSPDTLRSVRGQ